MERCYVCDGRCGAGPPGFYPCRYQRHHCRATNLLVGANELGLIWMVHRTASIMMVKLMMSSDEQCWQPAQKEGRNPSFAILPSSCWRPFPRPSRGQGALEVMCCGCGTAADENQSSHADTNILRRSASRTTSPQTSSASRP